MAEKRVGLLLLLVSPLGALNNAVEGSWLWKIVSCRVNDGLQSGPYSMSMAVRCGLSII